MLEEEYETSRRVLPAHLRPKPKPVTFSYEIRPADTADLGGITDLYNHYVRNTVVTLDEATKSLAYWRDRLSGADRMGLPFLVAVSPAGVVLGFAYVWPWRQRGNPKMAVENAIYLSPAATGRGLGKALLEALLEACIAANIREVIAVIVDQGAEASIALHQRLGFVESGRMGRVGRDFGRWLGTVLLRKRLPKPGRR
jgi:L-amino acid N-acyltransferase YncA